MPRDGLLGKTLDRLEELTGLTVVDGDYLRVQEAVASEAMVLAQELDEVGYTWMGFNQGRQNEVSAVTRRRWAQQARIVWQADPQAGAAVELLNEFSLGRGVPKPRAKDDEVQEVIDEYWDDPQNQRVLTGYASLVKLGTSLSIQSNVFPLVFDDGDDGKVKFSFLNHDTVESAYTDPLNRQRVLFYLARKHEGEWDFLTNTWKPVSRPDKLLYYENWGALHEALVERGEDTDEAKDWLDKLRKKVAGTEEVDSEYAYGQPGEEIDAMGTGLMLPPYNRWGEGKVYHLAENQDMEMIFGVPRMRRTIRWYTAYNDFMKARVDMAMGAAAFLAQKKIKGSPQAMEKIAQRATRAVSDLRATIDSTLIGGEEVKQGPRPASFATMTDSVTFEPLNLNSGAGNALTDGQMLRAQVSAGDRWPQHYLGDVGSANLATATSMELPALKHVEARMEVLENLLRFGIDRSIERAVEVGRLDPNVDTTTDENPKPEELVDQTGPYVNESLYEVLVESAQMMWRSRGKDVIRPTMVLRHLETGLPEFVLLREAHEDRQDDEQDTGRDLSYEFGMPSPLRRTMGDVVTAVSQLATMADPNGLNVELTRTLLTYAFAQGLEMQDASDVVDAIFPADYNPMAAMQAMQGGAPPGAAPDPFAPDATSQPADPNNPYSAPAQATPPEQVPLNEAGVVGYDRLGEPMILLPGRARVGQTPLGIDAAKRARQAGLDALFTAETRGATMEALAGLTMNRLVDEPTNGDH